MATTALTNPPPRSRRTPIDGDIYAPVIRHFAEAGLNDTVIGGIVGIGPDQVRHVRLRRNIPPGVNAGRPEADAAVAAIRNLIEDPDERQVAHRVIRLLEAGLTVDAAVRAARNPGEAVLANGVRVILDDLQDQAA